MSEITFVAPVKGSEEERFIFITMASDFSRIIHTSDAMTEETLRATLRKAGMPEHDIDQKVEAARAV